MTPDDGKSTPLPNSALDTEDVRQARVDLAACFRMAARLGLHEGICNHFSCMVPGRDDLFLVNPDGYAFSEITASKLLICDFDGNVIEGDGTPEDTAFFIHARLHMGHPAARAALPTLLPNATALAMLEGEPFVWAGQSSLKFYGRIIVDEDFNGLAHDTDEGDRIAEAMGDKPIAFLKNHGIVVTAPTIAKAWDDLYYLERAAAAQVIAMSTGRPLKAIPAEIAAKTAHQMTLGNRDSAGLHLESIKRTLFREEPDFAD